MADVISKIDMDNGNFPYAKDIGRVLAKTKLSNSHRGILDAVLDKTYGWYDRSSNKRKKIKQRKTSEKISYQFLEEFTGSPRCKLCVLIKELVNWQVLKRQKDGRQYIFSLNIIVADWDRRIFKKVFQLEGWGKVYQLVTVTNQERLPISNGKGYQSVTLYVTNQETKKSEDDSKNEHLKNPKETSTKETNNKETITKETIIKEINHRPIDKIEKDISPEEREVLKCLKGISVYPFDYDTDLEFLRTLWVDFPGIKILEELKKWAVWLMDNRKKLKGKMNYRLRFRNWLQITQGGRYGKHKGADKAGLGKSKEYEDIYEV